MATAKPALQRATAAVAAHDLAAARDALVDAWRARRSPAIAELVELLDARVPDAMSARLAAIVTPRVASSLVALANVAEVDDPRLASFALAALVDLPFTTPTALPFLALLVATVERLGDPRLVDRAPAIRAAIATRITRMAVRDELLARLAAAVAKVRAPRAAPADERALEAAIATGLETLRATTRSAASLLVDIYANPDDDGPRLVYADLLLEQGDVRGELIALQIERARAVPEPEPSAREVELLKKHGKAWLGPLAPVLSWGKSYASTRFRRGFVAVADIMLSVGKKLQPIMADPAWATVEKIEGLYDRELLATAPLRALRELDVGAALVPILARRREPLPSVVRAGVDAPLPDDVRRRVLPNLRTIAMDCPTLDRTAIAALAPMDVEHLELRHYHVEPARLADARRVFDAELARIVGTPAGFARVSLIPPFDRRPLPPPIELRRGADGRYERVP